MLPVSNTAYFCCGIRYDDSQSNEPLINDIYSEKFMSDKGFSIYKNFHANKYANRNILMRHYMIDEAVESYIEKTDENITFISIGSGLESRAFRAKSGNWIEIDEHQVIAYKDQRLPVDQCANKLIRIGVDFTGDELDRALMGIDVTSKVVVIVEGVFVYLDEKQIIETLKLMKHRLGEHVVITDFITKDFIDKYSKGFDKGVNALGAYYIPLKDPSGPFMGEHYQLLKKESVTNKALKRFGFWIMRLMLNMFMPSYIQGYTVATLSYNGKES